MYKSLICAALACALAACGDDGSDSGSGSSASDGSSATAMASASSTTAAAPGDASVAHATISSSSAAPGQSVSITVPVTYAAGQLIDFEIHGPDGARLAAPGCCQQQLTQAAGTAATFTYAVPASAVAGVYTVTVGVFTTDWSRLFSWNNSGATFSVGAASAGSSGSGATTASSSSGNSGSTNSGTTTAASSSSAVAPGQSVTISVPVTYATGQLIDFEIHGPDGTRLAAPGCCQQQLTKGAGTTATLTYTVPATAVSGVYTVTTGVFTTDWSHLFSWNNSAATFTVGRSASGSSSSGASTGSSSSGSAISSSSGGTTKASSSGSSSSSSSSSGAANTSGGPAAQIAARIGKPDRLLVGLGGQGDYAAIPAIISQGAKPDIYDLYLGGIGANSWVNYLSPAGQYVLAVAADADSVGAVPMFTLYQMDPSSVGNYLASSNLQNSGWMTTYWNQVRLMYQMIAKYGKPTLVNLEPDFFGFAQQQALAAGQDGAKTSAAVTVNPDCSSQPNNIIGLANCLVQMARKYAPNALVGFPPTDWGANGNIAQVVAFNNEINAGNADFIVAQTLDGDAGCYEAHAYQCTRGGTGYYWDESNATTPNFNQFFARVNQYQQGIGGGRLPVLLWQTPEGVPSTSYGYYEHFRDDRMHYFLTHTQQVVASHIFGISFSSGPNLTSIVTDGGQHQNLSNQNLANPTPLQ